MSIETARKAMLRTVLRRTARAVLIKDSRAYERLYVQLQDSMTKAWDDAMREGISDALDRLRDLGPGRFSKADAKAIMSALEARVGEEAIRAVMRDPMLKLTDGLFRTGAGEVAAAAGIAVTFNRPDLDALDIIKSGNLYWVGNSWNLHTQNRIDAVLRDYFTEAMTREELARRLAEDFAGVSEKSRQYWLMLADHTATKTREMGRVTGYERAGITHVQVRAHLDERTTAICRDMHGRVISVAAMRRQRDTYLEAASRRDEHAMKEAWPMLGAKADFSRTPTAKLPGNVAGPPYHFRCRTITVAYFASRNPADAWQQKLNDREVFSKAENEAITAHARNASWLSKAGEKRKWNKHRHALPVRKMVDMEASARAVIADPNSVQILSSRIPQARNSERTAHAVFALPAKHRTSKEDGYLVTAVDLKDNQIVSHHWRDSKSSHRDDIPGVEQKWKGLTKWLFG